ncbi:DinB family protein [Actinoplanes sp. NPDC026670]|uniref:DinB family protein n=1 Tax=Actinoplanes sp. NPDC026670 TaxID=3154700 RepID=UPI00341190CE
MPSEMTVSRTPKSEYDALENFLDAQRIGLIRKVEDVSDELARQAPTASSLSLLGLIKHAATWERRWFQVIMAGRTSPDGWPEVMPEPRDAELISHDSDTVANWIAVYREHIETSNTIAAAMDLDALCARTDLIECNLRYVLLHMIEETARHAGHADIIRETLDGSRGI